MGGAAQRPAPSPLMEAGVSSNTETIREGFVTSLAPLLASNGGPLSQISAYVMSNPSPPCAYISAGPIVYDRAMHRGLDEIEFTVTVIFPFNVDISQQASLDELRDGSGALSVKALVETDLTLGGAVQTLRVTQSTEPRLYTRQSGPLVFGCEWQVSVYPITD
jgi:hypothetical protein